MNSKYLLRPFELFFIILNITTYKIFTGYSSLFPNASGSSAPICVLISGLVVFGIIFLLLSLCEKNGSKSIIELAPSIFKLPVFLVLFAYLLFSAFATLRFSGELIKAVSFPSAPVSYIYLLILIAVAACCAQGFDAISRLHSIIIPILLAITFAILLFTFPHGKISNLFPYLGYGVSQTAMTAVSATGLYGDIIILFILFPFCGNETHLKRTALFAFGIGVLINTAIITGFTLLTPYSVSGTVSHPFLQLVKLFSAGKFFQRIDGYFMYIISGCGILILSLNIFIASFCAKQIFSLPKIRPLAYSLGLLILYLALIIQNREQAFNINTSGLTVLFGLSLLVTALIIIYAKVISKGKGKRKI